jgi:antitoxin HicB
MALLAICGEVVVMTEQTKILSYRIMLRHEPEGGYTVIVPTLPGCITYGSDIPEAIAMAREAIELYLESLIAHGEPIPNEEDTFEYTVTIPAYA